MPLNNDYVLLGFVSKGSTLELGITQYVWDFTSGNTSIRSTVGVVGGAYLQVYISDCNIY